MQIPAAYQKQAMTFAPALKQGGWNTQEHSKTSVSMRLGKLGITYSTQDAPAASASPAYSPEATSSFASRPSTSFAQELSLAMAKQAPAQALTTSLLHPDSQPISSLAKEQAFQAYVLQAAYLPNGNSPVFSAMV